MDPKIRVMIRVEDFRRISMLNNLNLGAIFLMPASQFMSRMGLQRL